MVLEEVFDVTSIINSNLTVEDLEIAEKGSILVWRATEESKIVGNVVTKNPKLVLKEKEKHESHQNVLRKLYEK